jgi:uncharacterized protein (DUF1330 family)
MRTKMPAYIIARVSITDPEQYRKYLEAVPAIIEQYGGRALARAPSPETLEGPGEHRRIVILRFPTMENARAFYNSPEYREAQKLREGASVGELILLEGSAP